MRIDPNLLEFESDRDIVDYITKGIVPRKNDAKEVIRAIREPESSVINLIYDPEDDENMSFDEIMNRVYENVREMQIIAGVGCALSGLLGFTLGRRYRR